MDLLKAVAATATWGLDLTNRPVALATARRYLDLVNLEAQHRREGRPAARRRDIARNRASLNDAIRYLEAV